MSDAMIYLYVFNIFNLYLKEITRPFFNLIPHETPCANHLLCLPCYSQPQNTFITK